MDTETKYEPGDLLTVAQAAKVKGVDATTIRKACESGEITAKKVNERLWILRYRDIQHWKRDPRGRPKKEKEHT